MGCVISTVNMKGGVGKTTLTVNLATCLAKYHRKRVLILDLDAQISATLSLMAPHDFAQMRKRRRTLTYLLDGIIQPNPYSKLNIRDIICPSVCNLEGLSLLPGDIELYDEYIVSEMLHNQAIAQENAEFDAVWNHFERLLIRQILEPIREEYDFIIMDCAPGYNLLTRSGLAASDFYLLPARPEPLSVRLLGPGVESGLGVGNRPGLGRPRQRLRRHHTAGRRAGGREPAPGRRDCAERRHRRL